MRYFAYHKNRETQAGFVLITVLFFTLVITIVTLSVAESSLLESRMSNYYAQEVNAFYAAEKKLQQAEQEVDQGKGDKKFPYLQLCKGDDSALIYVVDVEADYYEAALHMRSTFAKVASNTTCTNASKIKTGRQSWLIVDQ